MANAPIDRSSARLPQHISVIMDGNGRWATQRHLPRYMGHREGVKSLRAMVQHCNDLGISYLSIFAFSTENWSRPVKEVDVITRLFLFVLRYDIKDMHKNNIRLCVIGDVSRFSLRLQKRIVAAEKLTMDNTGLTLMVAANFGGRWDIVHAARAISEQVARGQLKPEDIDTETFSHYLAFAQYPDPDLLIRTGGEMRVSNFCLWDLAYSELYFTKTLWPDFNELELDKAIEVYQQRQRRFGLTGAQVEQE
jgi:undecaprenyl diphosphate synthase